MTFYKLCSARFWCWVLVCLGSCGDGASYEDTYDLEQQLFTNYSVNIRPLADQTRPIDISLKFYLVSVVEVDVVKQRVVVNGFFQITWTDEKLQWDPSNHGGIDSLRPNSKTIWTPRLMYLLSLDEPDAFRDFEPPTIVHHTGLVDWSPFINQPITCQFRMHKFPFDKHECPVDLAPVQMDASHAVFNLEEPSVGTDLLQPNGEWMVESVYVTVSNASAGNTTKTRICIFVTIGRYPTFFVINILVPVGMLSFLNSGVFFIPVESGEKTGYALTVLLALSVYMSIVNGQLPTVSDPMPVVTIYMAIALTMSVVVVLDVLFIVWLHRRNQESQENIKRLGMLKEAIEKWRLVRKQKTSKDRAPSRYPSVNPRSQHFEGRSRSPDNEEREVDITSPSRESREVEKKTSPVSYIAVPNNNVIERANVVEGESTTKLSKCDENAYKTLARNIDELSFYVYMLIYTVVCVSTYIKLTS